MLIKCHQVPHFLSLKGLSCNRQQREQHSHTVFVNRVLAQGKPRSWLRPARSTVSVRVRGGDQPRNPNPNDEELVLTEKTPLHIIFQLFSYFKYRQSKKYDPTLTHRHTHTHTHTRTHSPSGLGAGAGSRFKIKLEEST